MFDSQNHAHRIDEATQGPTPADDRSILWETHTFHVQTSGAPAPFAVKVLHGHRRDAAASDSDRQTVLAVHGLMHNALVFQPLGDELLRHPGKATGHFYAISLPGHGDAVEGSAHGMSAIPGHRRHGDVTLEDYAEAVIQVARQLGRIDTVVAHSQGGVVVQLAETMLQASGSSLRGGRTRTRRVVLLASTAPRAVAWEAADNGTLAGILGSLDAVKSDPEKGLFLSIGDSSWYGLFYSYPVLANPPVAVPGGPELATAVPHLRTDAPGAAAFQMLGVEQPRPAVPAGVFSRFSLVNVAFQDDAFLATDVLDRLGDHLKPGAGHVLIASQPGAPAIHCALYSQPAALVPYVLGTAPAAVEAGADRVAA